MATARRSTRGGSARDERAPARSSGYRGAAGLRKMSEEHERQEAQREAARSQMGMPFRFFCPVGETREIVIIDDAPDFFRYEHNLKNSRSGKWDIFCACINEVANCPICKNADRPAYFAMYLTVIDLTGYETKDGEEVPWSKKLLVVKSAQQKKIVRLYERHKTLRGMVLSMTRDGDKDAAIGNDIEFVEFMSEEDLETYESEYVDQNGKRHEVIGHEVFDYDELFPEPTEQQLRAIVGGKAEPGSLEDDQNETRSMRGRAAERSRAGRGGRDEQDDDEQDDRRETRSRPARGRGRDEDAQDVDYQESPRSRAAGRGRVRDADPADDEDAQDVRSERGARRARPTRDTDDEPQQQRRVATRRAAPPAEPDDDRNDDRPPPRSQSMADRRRALRRG